MKLSERTVVKNGKTVKMVMLQCDHDDHYQFEVPESTQLKLEAQFDGKHYCNTSIYELQKAGTLSTSLVKNYA